MSKHRDPLGFEFLVQKYRREAFCHAFALLGNQDDPLDACQDSFAKAFAAIPSLRDRPQFYPWFYCILRNRCLNLLARRQTSSRLQSLKPEHWEILVMKYVQEHRYQESLRSLASREAPS